mgnify:CR=1 FL=1
MKTYLEDSLKEMSSEDCQEEVWEAAQEYWLVLIEEHGAAQLVNLALGSLNDIRSMDKLPMQYFLDVIRNNGYLFPEDETFMRLKKAVARL